MSGKVLLIENEITWIERIQSALFSTGFDDVLTLENYTKAERELPKLNLEDFVLVLIDVRMRRPIFDQGGLALLDLLKSKAPDLPVIMLTAYAHDYPGLQKTTSRYKRVLAYDKEVFLESQLTIMRTLLQPLPPQVGEAYANDSAVTLPRGEASAKAGLFTKLSYVFVGFCCIVLVLAAGLATFTLLDRFKQFSKQGNVIFGIVAVCLMAVLIGTFGKETIQLAIRHSSSWLKSVFSGRGSTK